MMHSDNREILERYVEIALEGFEPTRDLAPDGALLQEFAIFLRGYGKQLEETERKRIQREILSGKVRN